MKDEVKFEDIVKYAKEVHRKHIAELGLRSFQHPTYSSAIIIVKDNEVLGMTNKSILRNNSKSNNIMMFGDYQEFHF